MTYRLICRLLVVAAVIATGCATEDTGGEQVGGTVEIAAVWTGEEQAAFRKVLDAFTEATGTEVTFTSTGDEIATVLRTRIEGRDPPAVAVLPQPGLLNDLAAQDALISIEEVAGEAVDDNWGPNWRELGSVDGELYGLFFKAANKSTIWYNVHVFEAAGVEPPETWEELQQRAQTINESGTTPWAIGGGQGWVLTDWFENIYLRTAGAEAYDQLVAHEIPWTDDSVKKALTVFADVLKDPALIARGDPTALQFVDSVDAVFKDPPDAAMVFEGDFVPGAATVEAEAGTDYDVFDFPSIEGSEPSVVGGGDAVVMLEDTEQARALIEFLSTAEAAEIWAAEGGFSSPNKAVDEGAYPNDIARKTAAALAEAEIFRFDLSDLVPTELGGDLPGSMWGILQEFAKNPAAVDDTANKLEAKAAAVSG